MFKTNVTACCVKTLKSHWRIMVIYSLSTLTVESDVNWTLMGIMYVMVKQ